MPHGMQRMESKLDMSNNFYNMCSKDIMKKGAKSIAIVALLFATGCATVGIDNMATGKQKGYADFYLKVRSGRWGYGISIAEEDSLGRRRKVGELGGFCAHARVIVATKPGDKKYIVSIGTGTCQVRATMVAGMISPICIDTRETWDESCSENEMLIHVNVIVLPPEPYAREIKRW